MVVGVAAASERQSVMPTQSLTISAVIAMSTLFAGCASQDPQTPICWWKSQDKQTWTVIYADLSTADEAVRPNVAPK